MNTKEIIRHVCDEPYHTSKSTVQKEQNEALRNCVFTRRLSQLLVSKRAIVGHKKGKKYRVRGIKKSHVGSRYRWGAPLDPLVKRVLDINPDFTFMQD